MVNAPTPQEQQPEAVTEADVVRQIDIISGSTKKSVFEQCVGRTAKIESNKSAGIRSYVDWWALVKAMQEGGQDISSMVRSLERWLREVREGTRGPRGKDSRIDQRLAGDLDTRLAKWLRDAEEVPPRRTRPPRNSFVDRRFIDDEE